MAQVSGFGLEELNLSARELEGLVEVDLSHKGLISVPQSVQDCVRLKGLNCAFNQISITESKPHQENDFFKPQQENKLDLLHPEDSIYSDDDLKEGAPDSSREPSGIDTTFSFTKLESLTVINLSHNIIESLPDSFFSLQNLESVNLSHNLLTFLPHHFQSAEKLRKLDLSWN